MQEKNQHGWEKKLKQDNVSFFWYLATSDPSLFLLKNWIQIEAGPPFLRDHKRLRAGVSDRDCSDGHASARAPVWALFERESSIGE